VSIFTGVLAFLGFGFGKFVGLDIRFGVAGLLVEESPVPAAPGPVSLSLTFSLSYS